MDGEGEVFGSVSRRDQVEKFSFNKKRLTCYQWDDAARFSENYLENKKNKIKISGKNQHGLPILLYGCVLRLPLTTFSYYTYDVIGLIGTRLQRLVVKNGPLQKGSHHFHAGRARRTFCFLVLIEKI